jgi:8-amino-7-oxononanoate synthase
MPGAAIEQTRASRATIGGAELIAFAGCNYLGLAHDPRVLACVREAAGRFGLSTSASRETSGNTPVHEQLEMELVRFIADVPPGPVGGVLVPDGYTANLAAAQGLVGRCGYAIVDRRAHASLADAARCAGMTVECFEHLDANAARRALGRLGGPAVVMTDGVFTTDGSVAPVADLLDALRDGDTLLIDDCHGFCVLGGGRGVCADHGLDPAALRDRLVITTTLAKGLGGGGGIVIADAGMIDRIRAQAHAYVCTTPISPIVAAGTLRALEIVREEPERIVRLSENARRLRVAMGEPIGDDRAAVPICARPVASESEGSALFARLRDAGVFVPLMAYPGGPTPWYLRASVTSEHTAEEIDCLALAMSAFSGGC